MNTRPITLFSVSSIVLIMSAWLLVPCGLLAFSASQEAGQLRAEIQIADKTLHTGVHEMNVTLLDQTSKSPVTDAKIAVEYLMPSLPGKKPMMHYETTATRRANTYSATLNFNMTGDWVIILTVNRAGSNETQTFKFPVRVQ